MSTFAKTARKVAFRTVLIVILTIVSTAVVASLATAALMHN